MKSKNKWLKKLNGDLYKNGPHDIPCTVVDEKNILFQHDDYAVLGDGTVVSFLSDEAVERISSSECNFEEAMMIVSKAFPDMTAHELEAMVWAAKQAVLDDPTRK